MTEGSVKLEFQDFDRNSPINSNISKSNDHHSHSVNLDILQDSPDRSDVENQDEYSHNTQSFWTFEYYQQFFDVNTDEVKNRIIWGMIPRPGVSYLNNVIKPNPDLYGPFWICITLIFTIAVSGNVANYLQFAQDGNFQWKYDFHLVSYAASAIFTYAWLLPLVLWGFLKSQNILQKNLKFLDLLCVYGYSLGIYIPVSILWVVQISWFQWLLVLVGAAFSGFVLLSTVGPAVEGNKKHIIQILVIILHFLLAVGFMMCFFHVPTIAEETDLKPVTSNITIVKSSIVKTEHQ